MSSPEPSPHQPPHVHHVSNLRFAWRVVKLLAKGFTMVFTVLLALGAGAIFIVPRVVSVDKVRQVLADQLQDTLHRPVAIGRVILTPRGVKLSDVKIMEPLGEATLLASDSAMVTIKLEPLLRRRLEINTVRLVGPKIRLARAEDGKWNFADMLSSSMTVRETSVGRFSLPISLAAEQISIEDGVLQLDDRVQRSSATVNKFNFACRQFNVDRPFSLKLAFHTIGHLLGREVNAAVSLEGSMSLASLNWFEAYLRAEKLEVKLDGRSFRGSGGLTGFAQSTIDADLALPALGQAEWDAYLKRPLDLAVPPSRLRLKMQVLPGRRFHVEHAQVRANPLVIAGSGEIDLGGEAPNLRADVALSEFPLEAAAAFKPSLALLAMKGLVKARVSVAGWGDKFSIASASAALKGLQATLKHGAIEGGDVDLSVADDFARFQLSVANGAFSAFGNSFSEISGNAGLSRGDLRIDRVALKWTDSRLRFKGKVVNLENPKEVSIAGTLDHLHWEKAQQLVAGILASVSTQAAAGEGLAAGDEDGPARRPWVRKFKRLIPRRFPDTVGHIRVGEVLHENFHFKNADLLWDVHGVTPTLRKVSGDVRVGFGPGRIEDIQTVQSYHKFLKIVFLPYIYMHKMNNLSVLSAATAYPKTLDFNRIEGQYGIDHGVVTTRFSHVDSPQLVAYADGSADFGTEHVDMNILTRLTSYRAPLPEWWVDELGRPAIGFRVKGDLNQPELEPRLHKMAAEEIERTLEDSRSRSKARFEAIEKLQTL